MRTKTLRKGWSKQVEDRKKLAIVKEAQRELQQEKERIKEQKKKEAEARKKKKEENERRGEVVQAVSE